MRNLVGKPSQAAARQNTGAARPASRAPLRPVALCAASVALVSLLLIFAVPGVASPRTRLRTRDRAATRSYLVAELTYEQSLIANASTSNAAVEALADRLEGECPGVLSGAQEPEAAWKPGEAQITSPRERGELNREQRQRSELELELLDDLTLNLVDTDRTQALAYAHTAASLDWTNAAVSAYVHTQAALLEWDLQSTHPDVCADMRAWVAGGYRTLPSATQAFLRERSAVEHSGRELLETLSHRAPSAVLESFEHTDNKLLADRLTRLTRKRRTYLNGLDMVFERLLTGLGLRSGRAALGGPPKGATVIQSGRTAVGSSFAIWTVPQPEGTAPGKSRCAVRVGLEEIETRQHGSYSRSSSEICLTRSDVDDPRMECEGNRWQIQGQTVEGAQSVRLTLKNGQQISSPVAVLPTADGGPTGYYYQVLHRPAQTPVLLVELDSSGKPLRTVKLSPQLACPRNFPKPPKPPESLPGGGTIVASRVPDGSQFVIIGSRTRFQGQIKNTINVIVAGEEPFTQTSGESSVSTLGEPSRHPRPFELQRETGCQPHEYAILYGRLPNPKDTVLVRTGTGLRTLRRVPFPRGLHMHGVLAYIALSAVPSEVLLRNPAGKTVFTERLTHPAREVRETCEGEAEGSAS